MEKKKRVSFGMFLVTIGIVYGDIGTSPLYVMKSILKGNGGIAHVNEDFILGALSLIIWTITLLTTVKYVLIAMRADNNGEGGIFSLYALVKKVAPWLIFPAMIGGAAVVLYFRTSARMEAAYGLAITVTMLMTTLLLAVYLWSIQKKQALAVGIALVFGAIEAVFFLSSLSKFALGGYVAVLMALVLFLIMVVWRRGTQLEQEYATRLPVGDYLPNLDTLHKDTSLPPLADNLVFLDKAGDMDTIDRDILYSILDKDPKRAAAYWFISMNVTDEPDTRRYSVETYGTDYIFRVRLDLGFKCHQRVNVYLRQIVRDLIESGELPPQERKYSIYGKSDVGSFKFVFLHKAVPSKSELSFLDELVLNTKYAIRRVAGSKVRWYGLDTSSLVVETVPFIVGGKTPRSSRLERVK